ncbi:hypothetical protein BGZ67_004295 [Mortierella alpina]|nr:hypothetical protein BGZ67_004295 [Mortierella alpina]
MCTLLRSSAASNDPLNLQGPVQVASKVGTKRAKVVPASQPKTTKGLVKDATAAASATENLNEDGSRTSVWLMKSEPDTFSIDDLIKAKDSTSHWDGVRNHEAKNLMKNSMKVGDQVLFYHSNTKVPGIVALAKIVRESYPDHTAFDPKSPYYDEKSLKEDPRWFMVDVQYARKLKRILSLKELQQYKDKELCHMKLLNRGRLSVQPVSNAEMKFLMDLEEKEIEDSS